MTLTSDHTTEDLPPSLVAERRGAVGVLTLSRSGERNVLNDATILGIERYFTTLTPGIGAVVITADGEHFCAGLDLNEITEHDTFGGLAHSRMRHRILS